MRRLKVCLLAVLALTACGGGYTQEELDAAVAEAVDEALADTQQNTTSTSSTTTTSTSTTTTTTLPSTTTTTLPPTTTTTAPPDPSSYAELSDRDYALWVRNADDHTGELIVVYGRVWQFDNATGPDQFLADTMGSEQDDWFDYEHSAFLVGTEEMFSDIVEDDLVKAYVRGGGSHTYETAIGGSNTVAVLYVDEIEVVGFAD